MPEMLVDAWQWLVSIPHLRLYLGIGWAIYLAMLGGWIVLQKREPVATLSWLLGLALLPYVGFLVYLLFGPQKIKRQRLRRARARLALPADDLPDPGDALVELGKLGVSTTGLGASSARSVQLLVDGDAKYTALLADIAAAREHVHLEYYIFEPDHIGARLRDALAERARAGVTVRLLLDAVGSSKAHRFFGPLLEAGGQVAWFHPSRIGRIWTRSWVNMRTHRKIVVIDGRIAYTGGINITDEEDESLRDDAYRDLHLRIEGDVVRLLQLVFVEDWIYASRREDVLTQLRSAPPPAAPGPHSAQVLTSGPDSSWEAIHRMHVSLIHAARQRVWLVTPYFVPGEAAMMALTSAALGGIDVRLVVPRMSDSRLVTLAARSYFGALLAAGVKVYEYGPRMLHTKALLIDDGVALVGSANFDQRSFRLNFEVTMMFRDADIAASLEALIAHDMVQARRVQKDRPRPMLRARLPEGLARLLSPLL